MFSAVAFVIFCAACSVLAFTRHPIYALYFYLATTYVHPPSRWWSYMLPDLRWALISAAVAALAVILHRGRLSQRPVWLANGAAIILILYGTWMWIQTSWALDLNEHLEGNVLFTKYMVAFWFIYRITDTKESLRYFLFTHALGCGMLGAMARFSEREAGRVESVGGPGIDDANSLGMFLATGAVVCLGLALSQKGWRRGLALLLLPLILEGFVVTNSRGAFLGLVAGALVLTISKASAHRRAFWAVTVVAALVAFVAVDKMFVERMFTIGDVASESDEAEMSARSRVAIVEAQLQMARDHPMGVGHRGTVTLSPLYLERKWLVGGGADADAARSSHNTALTALVEQGLIGATLYVFLIVWLIGAGFRIRRMDKQGANPELTTIGSTLCAAIAVVLVSGLATDYLLTEVQFWMFGGLVSVLQLHASQRAAASEVARAVSPGSFAGPSSPTP